MVGANRQIRDITALNWASRNGDICNSGIDTIGQHVESVDGKECWKHSHPYERNVYDFSGWSAIGSHPGNRDALSAGKVNPITKWADLGLAFIEFPSWHPTDRFETAAEGRFDDIIYIGREGDVIDFSDLPLQLKTPAMAKRIGAESSYPNVGFEACGSRGETANVGSKGNMFLFFEHSNYEADLQGRDQRYTNGGGGSSGLGGSKSTAWTNVVLTAEDQLRQRTAWALSQIFVCGAYNFNHGQWKF